MSSNGLKDDGCAMLESASFFAAAAAGAFFLKLGILVGLGLEKNEESDFASLTTCLLSFLTATALGVVVTGPGTAAFLTGGAPLAGFVSARRFLPFASTVMLWINTRRRR